MKFNRPKISIEVLEKFFSNLEEKPFSKFSRREVINIRKNSAHALWYLDRGQIRVMDETATTLNVWVKRAILYYFRTAKMAAQSAGVFEYFDKLPVKSRQSMKDVRVVPGAVARFGSFVEKGAILMPSFINVGAYVASETLVDTWATVGSCAQIGSRVHLSGGVGIGGVLEPAQAKPVVIEDGAFIGSRVIAVEGVRICKEAVIGAGVVLTSSTKIVDVREVDPRITTGLVPARAVVIPGSTSKRFPAGEFGVPCALIIGTRSASTDLKTSLNEALREHSVSV